MGSWVSDEVSNIRCTNGKDIVDFPMKKLNKMEIANLFKKEIFGAFIVINTKRNKSRILNKTSDDHRTWLKVSRLRLLVFVISRKTNG